MSNEEEYLLRSNKKRRRRTKEKVENSFVNRLVNILIVVVAALIILSITLILTNNDIKNENEQSSSVIADENEQLNNETKQEDEAEQSNEQQGGNSTEPSNVSEGTNGENEEVEVADESGSNEDELQYMTNIASEDPNVIVAFVDSRWTPYPTAQQTSTHVNAFDVNHVDYQEKLQLLYRDTGFTPDTSILWSIRNKTGDAVAVISAKDKTNIIRLTMKWLDGQGWQTTLVEQLYSLEGAY